MVNEGSPEESDPLPVLCLEALTGRTDLFLDFYLALHMHPQRFWNLLSGRGSD